MSDWETHGAAMARAYSERIQARAKAAFVKEAMRLVDAYVLAEQEVASAIPLDRKHYREVRDRARADLEAYLQEKP